YQTASSKHICRPQMEKRIILSLQCNFSNASSACARVSVGHPKATAPAWLQYGFPDACFAALISPLPQPLLHGARAASVNKGAFGRCRQMGDNSAFAGCVGPCATA